MSIMYVTQQPPALQANQASDDEKRFMLKHSKRMHLNDIAKTLSRKVGWVKS